MKTKANELCTLAMNAFRTLRSLTKSHLFHVCFNSVLARMFPLSCRQSATRQARCLHTEWAESRLCINVW